MNFNEGFLSQNKPFASATAENVWIYILFCASHWAFKLEKKPRISMCWAQLWLTTAALFLLCESDSLQCAWVFQTTSPPPPPPGCEFIRSISHAAFSRHSHQVNRPSSCVTALSTRNRSESRSCIITADYSRPNPVSRVKRNLWVMHIVLFMLNLLAHCSWNSASNAQNAFVLHHTLKMEEG